MKNKKLSARQIEILQVFQTLTLLLLTFAVFLLYQAAKTNAEAVQYLDMENTSLTLRLHAITAPSNEK